MRVTFRSAKRDHLAGVRTFYLSSLTGDAAVYTMKVIRRAGRRYMTCSCPDFIHDKQPKGRHCKHLHVLRRVLRYVGGVSRIPNGIERTVLTASPERRAARAAGGRIR